MFNSTITNSLPASTEPGVVALPFEQALGAGLAKAHPQIQSHFTQSLGVCRYRGTMQRVWRRKGWQGQLARWVLRFTSRHQMLFSQTGQNIPFELENRVSQLEDGRVQMSWKRTFYFEQGPECFYAEMVFDPARQLIVDYLGDKGQLEVELNCTIEEGALKLRSGRQWWHCGGLRLALPKWLRGQATVCEWYEVETEQFAIQVIVQNPLLGQFFGYQGRFELAR